MREQIIAWAKELGFDAIGFTKATLPKNASAGLNAFLANEYHGDMAWMAEHTDRRSNINTLWPEARSIIVLGHNYGPDYNPLDKLKSKNHGLVSCYALGKDYHDIIKKRLKILASKIAEHFFTEVKIFVDTAPLMEKPLAEQAGIGWQGKHTCLVSREFGSWLFLGEIAIALDIPEDNPEKDHCGNCRRCLNICPTGAFMESRQIDARKCISYLTIEHKGQIPLEFRKAIGNRIYGCDDCLAVCPWNKFAKKSSEIGYHAKEKDFPLLPLAELLLLDDTAFRTRFSGSPIKRIKRDRFVRNVLVAAGNSGDITLIPAVESLLNDTSPLVREMATWALQELKETVSLAK